MKEKLIILATSVVLALVAGEVLSSDDGHGKGFWKKTGDVAAVSNDQYREECGACHFAYPPGLLPAASWEKLMQGLNEHFGDNAEIDPELNKTLSDYLMANAADRSNYRRSVKLARSAGNGVPLRITEIGYFRKEHREIPARMVKTNAKVGSLSNCTACHRRAEAGSFREREIDIPGFGGWDD